VGLGNFAALADGFRNFDGFSKANTDAASFISRDNERAKAEATTAFDDFRRAVDENNLLGQLGSALTATGLIAALRRSGPDATRSATGATPAATATESTRIAIRRSCCCLRHKFPCSD
jgi:hypothetical protein